MHEERANFFQFLRDWAMNSVLVWPVVLCMWVMLWIPIGFVLAFVDHAPLTDFLSWLQLLLIPGAIAGGILGEMQEALMQQHLNWSSRRWHRVSFVGGVLGGILAVAVHQVTSQPQTPHAVLIALMPLFLGCLSLGQWVELRHMASQAWLWVLGNITAGLIFSSLVFINQPLFDNFLWVILWYGVALTAQGALTGYVMIWLYDHLRYDDDDDHGKRARVYVEVHNERRNHRR